MTTLVSQHRLRPEAVREIEVLRHAYETELETVLQDGVAQGVFDVPDPKVATLAVIAARSAGGGVGGFCAICGVAYAICGATSARSAARPAGICAICGGGRRCAGFSVARRAKL